MSAGRFAPLIRCDCAGCEALVEPHALRCEPCRRRLGDHPDSWGRPGRLVKPRPKKETAK